MSTSTPNKKQQLIRIGLIVLIILLVLTYNYTDIKAGFIEGWKSVR